LLASVHALEGLALLGLVSLLAQGVQGSRRVCAAVFMGSGARLAPSPERSSTAAGQTIHAGSS
jgi:hypothetical protein